MKRTLGILLLVLLVTGLTFAQQTPVAQPGNPSYAHGVAFAPNFGQWSVKMASAISATGSQTFFADRGSVQTNDGITFVPFAVNGKIIVGVGSSLETVTISAVSGCNALAQPGLPAVCSITATSFANNHSIGEPVQSGDTGIMEAVNFAANTGGGSVYFQVDCGPVTLSTSGLTTTSTCFVPTQFYNHGVAARVTTTITTSTNWALGIAGATSAFSTANATLTAGTTAIANQGAIATQGTTTNLGAVLITVTGANAGAGAVHIKAWGFTSAQPAF